MIPKVLVPRLTKWWSQHGSKLLSGLHEAIMNLDGSFGLELRLGVCGWVLVQNHELHEKRAP